MFAVGLMAVSCATQTAPDLVHPEIGRALLDSIAEQLKEVAVIERSPNMEGRFLSTILAPGHSKAKETAAATSGEG